MGASQVADSKRSWAFGLPARLVGSALLAIAAPLLWWGADLIALGGSAYYFVAGVGLLIAGTLLVMRRAAGAITYILVLLGTIVWALWEAGPSFWPLVPRIAGPLVIGLFLAIPGLWKPLTGWPRHAIAPKRGGALLLGGFAVAVTAGLGLHALSRPLEPWPIYRTGMIAAPAAAVASDPSTQTDWLNYGNDLGGSRFSPLDQINSGNVDKLEVAWTYRVGKDATGTYPMMEVNPLKVGDSVFVCTAYSDIISLDAETGRLKWRWKSGLDMSLTGNNGGHCRGLGYYKAQGRALCSERILLGTIDARLIAVDARKGTPCPDFGNGGVVDLMDGMGKWDRSFYYPTSGPTVVRGKVILDAFVRDGQQVNGPSGVIRAYDAITGKLAWAFDVGNESRTGAPLPGETYTPGTPNAWPPMSADEQLGLVYVPFGNSGPDFYSLHRRPIDEKINSSLVALDADTGRLRWRFQTTHRDVWDMDISAQPTLADVRINGVMRKAVIQATKRGEFFVLDRITGTPLHRVEERSTPQLGKLPEERLSPTQPFSTEMPSTRGPEPTERTMWGLSPLDQLWCRIRFHKMQYHGHLTPFGLTPTLMNPGAVGANSWGSVAIDKDRGLMVMNSMNMPGWGQLITRGLADRLGLKPGVNAVKPGEDDYFEIGDEAGAFPQAGTPYGAFYAASFQSPLKVPCTEPPYGSMSAVDLNTGKLVWTKPFGLADESGPWGLRSFIPLVIGTPNTGGAIATRGGISIIGASQDRRLRAFETTTGRILWSYKLPAAAMSTPSTYVSDTSGRQFIIVVAAGHAYIPSPPGDYVIAFALPRGSR